MSLGLVCMSKATRSPSGEKRRLRHGARVAHNGVTLPSRSIQEMGIPPPPVLVPGTYANRPVADAANHALPVPPFDATPSITGTVGPFTVRLLRSRGVAKSV